MSTAGQTLAQAQDRVVDLERKLAHELQREVHLQRSLDAEKRCNESLRRERDILQKSIDALSCIVGKQVKEIQALTTERDRFAAELTIAKQETANALHELRSAVAVIEEYFIHHDMVAEDDDGKTCPCEICERGGKWLTLHAQQPKAPLVDPEADAEQAKEAMLEDR